MYHVNKTKLDGCLELIPKIFNDHRGESVKPYHVDTFRNLGLEYNYGEDLMVTSFKGVLRGLHFQKPPFQQVKLIYCVRGSVVDVAVDIRKDSATFGQYVFFYLDGIRRNLAYIPAGFAHGYLVLEDNTTVIYKMSSVYSPEHEDGIRWDSLGINWPIDNPTISEKDKSLSVFKDFISSFDIEQQNVR